LAPLRAVPGLAQTPYVDRPAVVVVKEERTAVTAFVLDRPLFGGEETNGIPKGRRILPHIPAHVRIVIVEEVLEPPVDPAQHLVNLLVGRSTLILFHKPLPKVNQLGIGLDIG